MRERERERKNERERECVCASVSKFDVARRNSQSPIAIELLVVLDERLHQDRQSIEAPSFCLFEGNG